MTGFMRQARQHGAVRWIFAVALSIAIMMLVLVAWRHGSRPVPVTPDTQASIVISVGQKGVVTPPGHTKHDPVRSGVSMPEGGVNMLDWGRRYQVATDRFKFVSSAATAAYAGDSRAQYWIWEALRACWVTLRSYELEGKGNPQAGLKTRLAGMDGMRNLAPSLQTELRARTEAEYRQCAGFLDADPFASLPQRAGGYPYQYWLDRSIAEGDVLAGVEAARQASQAIERMRAAKTTPSTAILDDVRSYEMRALASLDPEALLQLGFLLAATTDSDVADTAAALLLMACEKGYDCNFSNPVFNGCSAALGNCAGVQGSWVDSMRDGAGPAGYAAIFARAQDIEDLVRRGETQAAFDKYLRPALPKP